MAQQPWGGLRAHTTYYSIAFTSSATPECCGMLAARTQRKNATKRNAVLADSVKVTITQSNSDLAYDAQYRAKAKLPPGDAPAQPAHTGSQWLMNSPLRPMTKHIVIMQSDTQGCREHGHEPPDPQATNNGRPVARPKPS